jgi:hypothetical protein
MARPSPSFRFSRDFITYTSDNDEPLSLSHVGGRGADGLGGDYTVISSLVKNAVSSSVDPMALSDGRDAVVYGDDGAGDGA